MSLSPAEEKGLETRQPFESRLIINIDVQTLTATSVEHTTRNTLARSRSDYARIDSALVWQASRSTGVNFARGILCPRPLDVQQTSQQRRH